LTTDIPRQTAYLIGVHQSGECIRVYAVLAPSPEVALEQIAASAAEGEQAKVVGSLARDLVRRLKLQTGEVRLVCALSGSRGGRRSDLLD